MQLNSQTRRKLRQQNLIHIILLLTLLLTSAWLTQQYRWQLDLSAYQRNSLNEASIKILKQLEDDIEIIVFINNNSRLRKAIQILISRYQQHKNNIHLQFTNPDTDPEQARALGISSNGELLINYQGRQERLQQINEQTLSNALLRLARSNDHWLVFSSGHGERSPHNEQDYNYSEFTQRLNNKGLRIQTLSLDNQTTIPDNTTVFIIASPQNDFSATETKAIHNFLNKGGNILWLLDPGSLHGLESVAEHLDITVLPGHIIDANTQKFGIEQVDFVVANSYPSGSLTDNFSQFTVFPQVAAIKYGHNKQFQASPFLKSLDSSWTETGPFKGHIKYNANSEEQLGPFNYGIALTKAAATAQQQQRIIVIGDSDFLSNTFIGNGGNLELGLNIINWLTHDDQLIQIRPIEAADRQLALHDWQIISIAMLFIFALPLSLCIAATTIWLKRRRK